MRLEFPFGLGFGDPTVGPDKTQVIDPFTGTGNHVLSSTGRKRGSGVELVAIVVHSHLRRRLQLRLTYNEKRVPSMDDRLSLP